MTVRQIIIEKLENLTTNLELSVVNESYQHSVPPGSETHFYIFMVSDFFEKMPLVQRHQTIYRTLDFEMKNGLHALRLQLYSISEYASQAYTKKPAPACMGGS